MTIHVKETPPTSLSAVDPAQLIYYPIQKRWKKLGPIFRSEEMTELAHSVMEIYAQHRARTYGFQHKPKEFSSSITPSDYDGCDWRLNTGRHGRQPDFWKYVCHGACHWTGPINIMAAMKAEPKKSWKLITSDRHTTVWDGEHTLFDPSYLAMRIPVADAWEYAAKQPETSVRTFEFTPDGQEGKVKVPAEGSFQELTAAMEGALA